MALFHKTLNDALDALKKGDAQLALRVLNSHKDSELTEENYIESSLYAIKLYLHNYIDRLNKAIELLSLKEMTDEQRSLSKEHINRCIVNIKEFEEAIKGLLKREGSLLE